MKMRMIAAALVATFVSACGGGGGGASAVPPPTSNTPQLVSFTFKVPTKAKQILRKRMIHGQYVSPATLGLGLNYSTTAPIFTPAQLAAPNVALNLTTCQATPVSTCTQNPDGSYTYVLTVPIPPGVYNCELVTWDIAPTSTPSFSGNQLSSAIFTVTVTSGGAPQTPPFVLNGAPASLALTAAPNQSHITQTSSGYTVVGNSTSTFFLNALDADGFVITGSGAPTLAISDSTGSFALTQNPSAPNVWTAVAQTAALSNATTNWNLSATAPAGSGIAPAVGSSAIGIEPELWVSGNAVYGYALKFTFGATPSAAQVSGGDNLGTFASSASIVVDTAGNLFVNEGNVIHLLSAATFLQPSVDTGSMVNTNAGGSDTIGAMVVDANDYLYVADSTDPSNAGSVLAYNNSVPNGTLGSVAFGATSGASAPVGSGTVTGGFPATLKAPTSIAICPAACGATLQGTFWVATSTGIEVLQKNGNAFADLGQAIALGAAPNAIAVGSDGTVWVYSGKSGVLTAYAITGTPSAPTLTQEATISEPNSPTSQMAADGIGRVYLETAVSTFYYLYPYSMSGCPSACAIAQGSTPSLYSSTAYTGVYLAP